LTAAWAKTDLKAITIQSKAKENPNQHLAVKTAHVRACIIVHNARKQYSTQQF